MKNKIELTVNGKGHALAVEPRRLLADVLREDCGLHGVHIGCAHGACGCCTVHVDGAPRLSCLTFAVQCDGKTIETVESLGGTDATHPLQQAFRKHHGLQCGYCTPGFLMALVPFVDAKVREGTMPPEAEIRDAMSGNICRCTGYQGIVEAVQDTIGQGLRSQGTGQ
ncbi:(2Fe-2S)-binding protein [Paracoccus sulfuroxidans]|uniref:Carbon-monoxide dehydrogenase small subunit n=1 Tax=Paracoccus sulfuroxidans TaxID=384678 RepID=A0A562NGC0_9RHOB|nr:(2Fe-2S)-binding protein [Paracoccus sulfuroxidans]TWI31245.1 carbon-monoxide dehydrogenase small subunit [Paracoccus sulfuroxidans]